MAISSVAELITTITVDKAKDKLLSVLSFAGFPVTAWQSTGFGRTLVAGLSELFSSVRSTQLQLALGGYLDTATGGWLTLLAKSVYQLDRFEAQPAIGTVTLTAATGVGPVTVNANQLIVTDSTGLRFIITGSGTIPLSGSLVVAVKSDGAGSKYNLASGTLTKLTTPIPGVSVNNPGTWRSQDGTDEELDTALATRCRLRWASLAFNRPADAYEYYARQASSEVTRVLVDTSTAPTVTVKVAGSTSTISGSALTAVTTALNDIKGIGATVSAANATTASRNLSGTVTYKAGYTITLAQITAAVGAFFGTVPIGGWNGGQLPTALVAQAIQQIPGIVYADITLSSTTLTAYQIPILGTNTCTLTAL